MDAPKISIIIPALNEEKCLPVTLRFLTNNGKLSEIIVSDGGSTDGTLDVCASFASVNIVRGEVRNNAVQLNLAAAKARGEYLLFLHADTLPPENFENLISSILESERFLAGSFYLEFDSPHPVLRVVSFLTRFTHSFFVYGDHGLFMKRSTYQTLGGIPEVEFLEIQAMIRKIKKFGKWKKVGYPVVTSSRRFLQNGVIRQICIDIYLMFLYSVGTDTRKIKDMYARMSGR